MLTDHKGNLSENTSIQQKVNVNPTKWKCILHINTNTKINQIQSCPLHTISQKHIKVVSWQSSGFRQRKGLDYSPFFFLLFFFSSIDVWIKRLQRFLSLSPSQGRWRRQCLFLHSHLKRRSNKGSGFHWKDTGTHLSNNSMPLAWGGNYVE